MMENLVRILDAAVCSFDNDFKCSVMLVETSQWAEFNKVYF